MTTTTSDGVATTRPAGQQPDPAHGPGTATRPRGRRAALRPGSHLFLVLTAAYFMLPVWWLVVAATKSNTALFDGAHGSMWFDDDVSFVDNLVQLSTRSDGIFWRWMGNSLFYAVTSGVGATVLAVLAGYGFAVYRFRGRNLAFSILLGAVMVPPTALVIPTFVMLANAGLTDTRWAVVLPSLLNPLGVYLMRVYIQDSIPPELLEAARVDGAGELRIFARVVLPLLRPAVVTVLLLTMVAAWNNYFLPLAMLNDPDLLPITVGLGQWQRLSSVGSGGEQVWNLVVTGALVSVVPLVVAFLCLQRYWRGGLTMGGVK
ncbi:carbohydrate ABC transporter permease [Nocardioides bruguierae]|uniref:Carbohydrate ABC transporter permease n=1 Tax=Nocardioides bruguierae TaxID=2945102 RepID=A0A9X2D4A7_9ACTN|nr:carbohydrate ABC transporter permease [Nocardioides bruguierae]MCM0618785.1 carbohydrate ABC transporter permease [Nocardioides bruguierae]